VQQSKKRGEGKCNGVGRGIKICAIEWGEDGMRHMQCSGESGKDKCNAVG